MDYSAMPEELRRLDQWVCSWESSKVPMQAWTVIGASTVDPSTWAPYEIACASVAAGMYDYLGFVFHNNGIVGIDIDTGYEDKLLTPLCADIIKACGSYTEKSKSGRGVHIFVKGQLPFPGRNNQAGVEIYRDKRYFVCTGKQICFRELIENQPGIDYVLDKYFQEASQQPRNAGKFERSGRTGKIYRPEYKRPQKGRIALDPQHPEIRSGNRHLSMLSMAGQMWSTGYKLGDIYQELLRVNAASCKPPLPAREIESICKSISKYER